MAWLLLAWAGFFATLVVSWLAAFAYWRGIAALRPAAALGALVWRGGGRGSLLLGGALHFLLGTLAFPTLYGLAFELLGRADVPLGAAFGLVHGIVAGIALPRLWRAARLPGNARAFGRGLGAATPYGLLAAHVVYGALLGYIYVVPG